MDETIPRPASRSMSASAPGSSGAIVMIRSPSSEASTTAGSMFSGVRSSAGSWAPLRAGAMNGPSRLKPSGSAPSAGAEGIHSRTRAAKRGISCSGSDGAVGRKEVIPCRSRARAIPDRASASPVPSWPPQPWTWTSMRPGARSGPAAHAAFPGSVDDVRDPAVLDDQATGNHVVREHEPSLDDLTHRWPP